MKKAFKSLAKSLPFVVLGAVLSCVFGVLAFSFSYNKITSWLDLGSFCTLAFIFVLLFVIGYAIFVVCRVKHFHIAKIKRNSHFARTASSLCAIVVGFLFLFDFFRLAVSSYSQTGTFNAWRIIRFILSLPFTAYFVIMTLPSKIRRKKTKIPKYLRYICSTSAVLWCVFSILTIYFYKEMTTTNVLKLWQIILYLAYAIFFLYETKFELIEPCPKVFMISGLVSFILSIAFTLSTMISRMLNFIPQENSLSAVELVCSLVIGVYALSRVHAIPKTMKHVINNSEREFFSEKFAKDPKVAPANEEKSN